MPEKAVHRRSTRTIQSRLLLLGLIIMALFADFASAASFKAETTFLELNSTLEHVTVLEDAAFSEHQAIMLNPLKTHAAAWIRIHLPQDHKTYRLTMPFSLRTQMNIYAYRKDGTVSEYDLGAYGADTQHHTSAVGHQIQLDPARLDFRQPLYIKAHTSIFLNQAFELLEESDFTALNQQLSTTHQLMLALCIIALISFGYILCCHPSALVATVFTFLVGLIFFILSSISHNLITSINFRSPALHNIALFDMPLMFTLVSMCFRNLGFLRLIAPNLDRLLLAVQLTGLLAAVSSFFLHQDTADNLAFTSVVINLLASSFCVVVLFLNHRKHRASRLAIVTFGSPSLGTLLYMGPAYFELASPTSGYMALPIAIILMVLMLLRLIPLIISGAIQSERQSLISTLAPEKAYRPLAVRYTSIVLSFSIMLVASGSILQFALNSRSTEANYRNISTASFQSIESALAALLADRTFPTNTIDTTLAQTGIAIVQMTKGHRDGPIIYSWGQEPVKRAHHSYFNVERNGIQGKVRIAVDIENASSREEIENTDLLRDNLVIAIILSFFSLAVFRTFVTNHLESFAKHLSKIHLKKGKIPLALARDSDLYIDEFDAMQKALEAMETDLRDSYKKLRNTNTQLEEEVIKRTAAHKELLEREHRKRELVTMGLMVASVAHELRNPMGTLASSAMLIRHSQGAIQPHITDRIDRSIERCNRVIEELRVLGRQSNLKHLPTPVSTWLEGIVDDYEALHKISIQKRLEPDRTFNLDRTRLERAIIILLDNAREAICKAATVWPENGQIFLEVQYDKDMLVITITDNGGGLPKEAEHRIFDPLFTSKTSGFGMGLAIALDIVEQHEGKLTVKTLNAGAVAAIVLPIELTADV